MIAHRVDVRHFQPARRPGPASQSRYVQPSPAPLRVSVRSRHVTMVRLSMVGIPALRAGIPVTAPKLDDVVSKSTDQSGSAGTGAQPGQRSMTRGVVPPSEARRGSQTYRWYRGTDAPKFAHVVEAECASILDYYGVPWQYEPITFVLETDAAGRIVEAFSPDFYLPEQNLFLEITTMRQELVTRKNRKMRKLRERYPDVQAKLFYRRDIEALGRQLLARRRPIAESALPQRSGSAPASIGP